MYHYPLTFVLSLRREGRVRGIKRKDRRWFNRKKENNRKLHNINLMKSQRKPNLDNPIPIL